MQCLKYFNCIIKNDFKPRVDNEELQITVNKHIYIVMFYFKRYTQLQNQHLMLFMHIFYSIFETIFSKLSKLYYENIGLNWTSKVKVNHFKEL